jgi:hypothetical protein
MRNIVVFSVVSTLFGALINNSLHAQKSTPNALPGIDEIYVEDQQARQGRVPGAPAPTYKTDEERESATRKLLDDGKLQSGRELREAAVIFQHSHQPDDYLLAHTLAIIAISKGDTDSIWIAAASLDRYLMAIGKPQVYGTQFMTPPAQHATQEPYNKSLISDDLRRALHVPSQADQEIRRKQFDTP